MDGVLVKMANGDNENFRTATSFTAGPRSSDSGPGQWLYVMQDEQQLGLFPPGNWVGVRFLDGRTSHVRTSKPSEPADLCADPRAT